MKLSFLLFVLYLKLARAAKTHRAFRNYIGTVRLKILIKTADNRHGRLFVFDGGKVTSKAGANHESDAALVWSDANTAFKVMLSGTEEATFIAAASGKVKVEGMAYYIQWFNDAVKLVM